MKLKEKWLATKLRKHGLSYKEILKQIKVSKASLSLWLRDVELTPEQKRQLLTKMDCVRYEVAKRKVAKRIQRTKNIMAAARGEVQFFTRNPLFMVGLALYWAEGAKNAMESVKLVNSDPHMIMLAMRWFREVCNVPEEKFRIHIHMHDLHSRKNVNSYWASCTGIPLRQFYKPYIKHSSLGQRRNILYNGTCSITVNDKNLFRKIMGWRLGVLDYFNIPS